MKITLAPAPGPDGRRDLTFGTEGQPGWFTWAATQHDLDDLEAVLAADKAKSRHCAAESGEHTCVMPPGHWIFPHLCRACPHKWVTAGLRERGDQRTAERAADGRPAPMTGSLTAAQIEQRLKARLVTAPLARPERVLAEIRATASVLHHARLGTWTYRVRPGTITPRETPGLRVQVAALDGDAWQLLDGERVIARRRLP